MRSKRDGENGRMWVDGVVRITWLTICSVTRRRFSSSSGTECGEGIARVHSPESYFPLAYYRTVRATDRYIYAGYTDVYPQSRPRTRAFNADERYLKPARFALRLNYSKWQRSQSCKQHFCESDLGGKRGEAIYIHTYSFALDNY